MKVLFDNGFSIILCVIGLTVIDFCAGGQLCYDCKKIPEPHDCESVIECLDGEQCFADFYVTQQGHVFYDLGCQPDRVCNALNTFGKKRSAERRQDNNLHLCEECCNTAKCNRHSCSDRNNYQNRSICYDCPDVSHATDCSTVTICKEGYICIAKKQITDLWETRWHLGCETERQCKASAQSKYYGHPVQTPVIGKRESYRKGRQSYLFPLDDCLYCCKDAYCNHKECVKGAAATTSQAPTPKSSTSTSPTSATTSTTAKQVVTSKIHVTTTRPTIKYTVTTQPTTTTKSSQWTIKHTAATAKPSTTTSKHHATTTKPTTTTKQHHATTTTRHHHATTIKPTTTTRKHHATTAKPTTTTRQHHATTTTRHHHATTTKPTTTTRKHHATTAKPTTTTRKHHATTAKPTTTTRKHHTTTTKPTTTTRHHHVTTTKPRTTTQSTLSCIYCDFVSHEILCNHTTTCNQGMQCFLARVDGNDLNDHRCFYNMGCMSDSDCTSYKHDIAMHGKASVFSGEDYEYLECCKTKNCNDHTVTKKPQHCLPATEPPPVIVG